jgi:hypothetical protein
MTFPSQTRLVGYQVESTTRHLPEKWGIAEIDGEPHQHILTLSTQPRDFIDVGRNEDGDLVWVSPQRGERLILSALSTTPPLPLSFEPPYNDEELLEVLPSGSGVFRSFGDIFTRRRVLVMSSAVSGVLLVLVGVGITSRPADSTAASPQKTVESIQVSNQPLSSPSQAPTEAALDFVAEGKVPGISVPDGLTRDSLSALVVSSSGEIVLVDVQADQPEGLTTFATLLLQKSGTAWRIREVFDPR